MAGSKKYSTSPVKNGVAKVPVIMQYENLECGAVSLAMVLGYYGKWIEPGNVRADTGPCRDGANAENIAKAARSYGLTAQVERLDAEEFLKKATFPCIVHWKYVHFLVVRGVKGKKVYINDPRRGDYAETLESFSANFTGYCVFFTPGPDFVPEGRRKTLWDFIAQRLKNAKSEMIFVLVTTVLASLMALANQGFSRVFLDRLLKGDNQEWIHPFLLLCAVMAAAAILVDLLKTYYNLRMNGKMSIVGNASYMEHVLKLPVSFFAQRLPGDINFRRTLSAEVSNTLVQTFGPLLLQTCMMVLYVTVMARYSPLLALIGVASTALNAVTSQAISKKRVNVLRQQFSNGGQMTGTLAAGIQTIETIKASGAENGFFGLWAGYQAQNAATMVQFARLNQVLGVIPSMISLLTGNLVLIAGVLLIMRGDFTPGMLMAFQGILNLFCQPAGQLITAGKDIQEMRSKMERIDDVMEAPVDPMWKEGTAREDISYEKLKGQLTMKGVSFGYSRLDEPLIRDFDLEMTPGKSVALVGPSGCGKSTITKLISGLYQPWSGEITFDGTPLMELDTAVLRGSLAIVDQDITLFEDTIANNITMWDQTIEDYEVFLAASDAQIHRDILAREKGYQHRLLPDGKDFSGGQRQRLEIARVLAQDPSIIILDEATSALDARTEYDVVRSIRDRGVTTIVIAHRLSTIRDCDEIIVLEHGCVLERGTHNELLKKNGKYAELIRNS